LLIVQLIERLRQWGWEMQVASAFTAPVLSDLAQLISSNTVQSYEPPANLIRTDSDSISTQMLPLFALQSGSNLLSQTDIDRIINQVPGGVGNIQDIYPLSPLQEGILFHHQLSEQDVYITPTLLKVQSQRQVQGFVSALQSVLDRHDILRTAFLWKGLSQSVQVVYRERRCCRYRIWRLI